MQYILKVARVNIIELTTFIFYIDVYHKSETKTKYMENAIL